MSFENFKEIKDHCEKWRKDSVEFFNENIAENSELDQRIMIARIRSLEQDMKQVLCYVEVLADLLSSKFDNPDLQKNTKN